MSYFSLLNAPRLQLEMCNILTCPCHLVTQAAELQKRPDLLIPIREFACIKNYALANSSPTKAMLELRAQVGEFRAMEILFLSLQAAKESLSQASMVTAGRSSNDSSTMGSPATQTYHSISPARAFEPTIRIAQHC